MKSPILSATALIVSLVSGAAYAQMAPMPGDRQIAVSYADLDISGREGAAALIARMKVAAVQVCGPAPDIKPLAMYRLYLRCVKDAVDRGAASVNAPMVTELHLGRTAVTLSQN
jgi:UrcA family protein